MSEPEDDQRTADFSSGTAPGLQALAQRYDLLGEVGRGGMGVVYKPATAKRATWSRSRFCCRKSPHALR